MEYYYALLENYKQLKRREFKLSLREEEEGEQLSDEEKINKLVGAAGESKDKPGKLNGFNLWKGESSTGERGEDGALKYEPNDSVTAQPEGDPNAQSAMLVDKNGKFGKSRTSLKYLSQIFAGKDKDDSSGAGAGEGGDDAKETETSELQGQVKELQREVGSLFKELGKMPGITPGVQQRIRGTATYLSDIAKGQTQGFIGDIDQKVLNSTDIPDEEKIAALQGLQEVGESMKALRERQGSGEPLTAAEAERLGKVLSKIRITKQGVLIEGIGVNYRQNSTPENDPLRNMVEQLNEQAEAYNATLSNLPDEERKRAEIPTAKKATQPPSSGGAAESFRGPVAEKFMKCSLAIQKARGAYRQAKTPAERKAALDKYKEELFKVYQDAMADGSFEKYVQVFSVGNSVAIGEMLAKGPSQLSDAEYVDTCYKVLVEDVGMDPARAKQFIDDASNNGQPDRQLMMSIIVTSLVNQSFDTQLFGDDPDLMPSNIRHEGGNDMTDSGTKADLVFEFDQDCDKVKAHYEEKLGSSPKGGCDGGESGIDNLLKEKEGGGCEMQVELKTLSDSKKKGGVGELSSGRMADICDDTEVGEDRGSGKMTQATKDYGKANAERLDKCLGREGVQAAACKKHTAIRRLAQKYDNVLTPGYPGVTPEMSDEVIDKWFGGKTDSPDNRERRDRAKAAMRGSTNPEDLKALKKLKQDIEQEILKNNLQTDLEAGARITDEGWADWCATTYGLAAGTSSETLRVTRGLEDNYQSVYLNNAAVQENLQKIKDKKAHFVYEGGGTIKLVDAETGETLASCDTARGQQKWTMGPKSGQRQVLESVTLGEQDLFMTFLSGQMNLLERLMHQTRSGPSI